VIAALMGEVKMTGQSPVDINIENFTKKWTDLSVFYFYLFPFPPSKITCFDCPFTLHKYTPGATCWPESLVPFYIRTMFPFLFPLNRFIKYFVSQRTTEWKPLSYNEKNKKTLWNSVSSLWTSV
jgi:hypothetical protein